MMFLQSLKEAAVLGNPDTQVPTAKALNVGWRHVSCGVECTCLCHGEAPYVEAIAIIDASTGSSLFAIERT
jgi:hypothetical protein